MKCLDGALEAAAGKAVKSLGLFPAMVFETLSRESPAPGADPLRVEPCSLRGDDEFGGSVALFKRLRAQVHDRPGPKLQDLDAEARKATAVALAAVRSAVAVEGTDHMQACVTTSVSDHTVTLACKSVIDGKPSLMVHSLQRAHYDKLQRLYCGGGSKDDMSEAIFVTLQRYFNLNGADGSEAESGWHGAVPPRVMRAMHAELSVSAECFASPFNCFFSKYFSAFPDTDNAFGSMGSFFDADIVEGSLEANPPFDHTVAVRMAEHISRLLQATTRPLSFLVVLPYSDRGKPLASMGPVVTLMRGCGFLQAEETVAAAECDYIDGFQQCAADSAFVARLDTRLFLLQNQPGAAKWPRANLAQVTAAWRGLGADLEEAGGAAGKQARVEVA
jgi:hypothetical protein